MFIAMPNPHTPKALAGRHVIEYLDFLTWNQNRNKNKKNPIAQRLIKAMEKPPHLTHEDIEALHQSIEAGKTPVKFDSPFEPEEHEKQ